VKVLIVDEQAHTRQNLIHLCGRSDDVRVVGEAACGRSALYAAGQLNPDIMLMDVELPDMSGFDLLRAVGLDTHAMGIMVAKCADYAYTAFAEGAIDYLVTPVAADRFDRAIARARDRLDHELMGTADQSPHLVRPGRTGLPPFLVGEQQRRLYPLDPRSIDYIEVDGNYVTLRAGRTEYLSRDSLKRLSTQLTALGFIRIERSLLVNAASVSYVEVTGRGRFALTLKSGVCLHSSTAYRGDILRVFPLPRRYRDTSL
jgi:two-component system LytT family response regulator